ncbi:MAG: hypothetical protein KC503_46405 [Myxococcales bacterium]|nr:hypothetical protein [Myxococcales bacterium]
MANLRLLPLDEILAAAEVGQLMKQIQALGVDEVPEGDEVIELEESISDDAFDDFVDRLEAHEVAADIYLPVEFEGRLELGETRVCSCFALADALEELRDELDIDDEDGPELADDEELEMELVEEQLHHAWKVFARAANACVEHHLSIHVVS